MSFRNWLSADIATAKIATSATYRPTKEPTLASVATVAVAIPSESVFVSYHREWMAEWKAERLLLSQGSELLFMPGGLIVDALGRAVSIWNESTGQSRTLHELREELTDDDLTDYELMTAAGLALYCWGLWADG